jgi:hypothetical protein
MNCDYVKSNAVLLVYDELPDDVRHEISQHVERCSMCAEELKAMHALHGAMSLVEQPEPTPNLLAASRMRLQEALEHTSQAHGWRRFTFDVGRMFEQLRLAPAAAMALLIVGFAGGSMTTWKIASGSRVNTRGNNVATVDGGVADTTEASISGIRSIEQRPGTNTVEIKYDKVLHDQAEGQLSDPQIQQLLLFAAHSNLNSGVRMESVNFLAQSPDDQRVRESLMYSLRYDSNPGVRLKAVEALGKYVRDDMRVRDAVLESLMNDNSPGVRIEAMHALQAAQADSAVRRVFSDLARNDRNQYIRRKAQEALNATSAID